MPLQCDGNRFGNSPHEADQLTRNGHDHLVGMFPTRAQVAVPFTESDLGFPTAGWDRFGLFFQSKLEMPAHFRWVAIRPGAFHEDTTGMSALGVSKRVRSPISATVVTATVH